MHTMDKFIHVMVCFPIIGRTGREFCWPLVAGQYREGFRRRKDF